MTEEYLYEKAKAVYGKYKECKELQSSINVKTVVSFALTVIWYVIWITSAITYFKNPWASFNYKNIITYITFIVILVIPFLLFKPQKYARFKPFLGIIEKHDVSHIRYSYSHSTTNAVFIIKSVDGKKTKKIKVKAVSNVFNYFAVGTPVVILRGVTYPVKIDTSAENQADKQIFCPNCGHFNPERYERCFECSTVVWNKD